MSKGRLEAFSDGVFAVIITIMVLDMKVPHGTDLQALKSSGSRVSLLRSKLHLGWNLLEQSPSSSECIRPRHGRNSLG
jgi:hypothetical protein